MSSHPTEMTCPTFIHRVLMGKVKRFGTEGRREGGRECGASRSTSLSEEWNGRDDRASEPQRLRVRACVERRCCCTFDVHRARASSCACPSGLGPGASKERRVGEQNAP